MLSATVPQSQIRLIDRVTLKGAIGYDCKILAYHPHVGRRTFPATIAAPSDTSARRVLKEEAGSEWTLLDWNAG